MEEYRSIKGYEGIYEISNLGNVKSLSRKGVLKDRVLKPFLTGRKGNQYLSVKLNEKTKQIHKLLAIVYLNHVPKGMDIVVNHKDLNRLNNSLENLELITQKENANKKHIKSVSKYTGVCWHKAAKKWIAQTTINGKYKYLGLFEEEFLANKAYLQANERAEISK